MIHIKDSIKCILFDADDTLWENENHFQEFERQFCEILSVYATPEQVSNELYHIEMKNLPLYGYGAKGLMLCMIEVMCNITKDAGSMKDVDELISLGKQLIMRPIALLPNVESVLEKLSKKYKLVLATKGDLLDQRRKIHSSGLAKYFSHIEIMDNKNVGDYKRLFDLIDCSAKNILMVGNSIKSDILPVLELGGNAIHIPFRTTWLHEQHSDEIPNKYLKLKNFDELITYLI